jgi:hypothetical protein
MQSRSTCEPPPLAKTAPLAKNRHSAPLAKNACMSLIKGSKNLEWLKDQHWMLKIVN